ncbi:Nucleic acid-binding, OB-fold [Sesbania bispinosa]|nr:Nucleic acid-binding, OB-fold [Sesbania bispinosa]
MASRYDLICNVNGGSEHKIWRIKVRVIRLWREGRIQCTVKSIHVYLFENSINEGNVYMLENLSVALNSGKYKPTMHEFRMFFKRETRVTLVEDSSIPLYGEVLNLGLSDHASLTLEEEFLERGVYKSIADLKEVTQSGDKNRHPEEIDSFKDKKFLFKVQVKIQDMESIVPYVISISRLCFEDNIIASFEKKYQIEEVALIQDNSELLSQFTESSDLLKDNLSVSCDNGVDTPSPLLPTGKTASNMDSSVIKVLDVDLAEYCGNASFDTPSKCKGEMHSEQTIVSRCCSW